jgi:hypothetical protein
VTNSTTQSASSAALPPTDAAKSSPNGGLKYATINAHTAPGRDWIGLVDLSPLYGVPKDPPEYWKIYRLKPRGHETIELFAGTLYRARVGGLHFGLYIDADGNIHCFQKKAFLRELDRRYRDGAKTVDLTCSGNWSKDPFSRSIPVANLGESRFWLDPQ